MRGRTSLLAWVRLCGVGRWLAAIALAVQVAAAATVPVGMAQAATIDRLVAASICDGGPTDHQLPAHHSAPDCAICPFCQALGQATLLLAPLAVAFDLPRPSVVRVALPPPARAPPARVAAAAYPRGPPLPL
jgi:hypothetical protein